MIEDILVIAGMIMVGLGAVADLIAAIGLNRFKNFYLRLHAATVGTIWGAFVPLIGASLIATGCECLGMYRWFIAGGGLIAALLVLILAPAGSHALARATHRSGIVRVEPCVVDQLDESMCVKKDSEG